MQNELIGAVKAGWLAKERGTWTGTELGFSAIDSFSDDAGLAREAHRLYRLWARSRPPVETVETETESSDVTAAVTLEEAEEAAWSEISKFLGEMPPYEFQELVATMTSVPHVSPPTPKIPWIKAHVVSIRTPWPGMTSTTRPST